MGAKQQWALREIAHAWSHYLGLLSFTTSHLAPTSLVDGSGLRGLGTLENCMLGHVLLVELPLLLDANVLLIVRLSKNVFLN